MMPTMNGWAFLEEKAHHRDLVEIPVLVVSGASDRELGEARDLGAPLFLAKPFDVEDLLMQVQRLCEGPIRQCAWCGRVTDERGEFTLQSRRKLRWATHGICPTCKDREQLAILN
jgi:response regulator RpfG family c-di-GMP phosphodiesterase